MDRASNSSYANARYPWYLKAMESAKDKFRKAFEEQERATNAFNTANSDGSVTKNDIMKLNMQAVAKTAQCDLMKGQYANQMLKVLI